MRGVALTIERSMIQASQKVDSVPKDIILAFSSSQIISDHITTQYIRNSATAITMSEVDTMVKTKVWPDVKPMIFLMKNGNL